MTYTEYTLSIYIMQVECGETDHAKNCICMEILYVHREDHN